MSIIKTFAKFSVGSWLGALISLITTPVTAWLINPNEFGKASMFTLVYSLLLSFSTLGLDQSFSRYYVETNEKDYYKLLRGVVIPSFIIISLLSIVIITCRYWVSEILFDSRDYSSFSILLCGALFFGVLSRFAQLSIRMKNEALNFSKIQIISALLAFFLLLIYAKYVSNTFEAIVVTFFIAQLFTFLISMYYDKKRWFSFFTSRFSKTEIYNKKYLLYGLPFIPTFLLDWLFQGVDRTFLRYYSDFQQIGIYALAFKISLSLSVIQTGFVTFWLPYSLKKYEDGTGDLKDFGKIFNVLTFLFGVLITVIILLHQLIFFIVPQSYSGIVNVFPFILFIPMLYSLSEITVVGVNFTKKTFFHLIIIAISVVVNIIVAYLLIPKLGAVGASLSMFFGYITFFAFRSYYGLKSVSFEIDFKKFVFAFSLILIPVLLVTLYKESISYLIGIITIPLLWFMYRNDLKEIRRIR